MIEIRKHKNLEVVLLGIGMYEGPPSFSSSLVYSIWVEDSVFFMQAKDFEEFANTLCTFPKEWINEDSKWVICKGDQRWQLTVRIREQYQEKKLLVKLMFNSGQSQLLPHMEVTENGFQQLLQKLQTELIQIEREKNEHESQSGNQVAVTDKELKNQPMG